VQPPNGFVIILWNAGLQKSSAPAIGEQVPTTGPLCETMRKYTSLFSIDFPNRFSGQASRRNKQYENLGLKTSLLSSSSPYIKSRYLIQI